MADVQINYLAVLVAALVGMGIGAAWYSPFGFAKEWIKLSKVDEKKARESSGKVMGLAFVITLVMAYVLAHFIDFAEAETLVDGAVTGFWAAIGLAATAILIHDIFEGRPQKLTLINIGYSLVELVVMGAILAAWN